MEKRIFRPAALELQALNRQTIEQEHYQEEDRGVARHNQQMSHPLPFVAALANLF